MAKVNGKSGAVKVVGDKNTKLNHEGGIVHQSNELETLYNKVLGSFMGESTHYENKDVDSDFKELQNLVSKVADDDKEYILKIAAIGRASRMLHNPLSLLDIAFNDERFKGANFLDKSGKSKLSDYARKIILRSKDITDVLALQFANYGFDVVKGKRNRALPMQLRKALKASLEKMKLESLSKGLGYNNEVKLADAIKLLRPISEGARSKFFKDVIEGRAKFGNDKPQLQSALSTANNKENVIHKEKVEEIGSSLKNSSVQAIIKNLVSLYKQGVLREAKNLDTVVEILTDKKRIKSSMLLPFRFYSAFKEVEKLNSNDLVVKKVLSALEDAMDLSIENLEKIEGMSCVLADVSGSMDCRISDKSVVTASEMALVLGAILYKNGEGDFYVFADTAAKVDISRKSTIFDIVKAAKSVSHKAGGCTYLNVALDVVFKNGASYDNLIILTDNDCYEKIYGRYNGDNKKLAFDDKFNGYIKNKQLKKVWLNSLLGNDYTVVNTEDGRKNIITGFSENVVNNIATYNKLGEIKSRDIREYIDLQFEEIFGSNSNIKRKK